MSKNILVISCDVRETRVALIEDGIIAELHIERFTGAQAAGGRRGGGGNVGDVYLGKVTRVLPGLQAAFIDIGLERAAFLHVEDLIRPDDFEAYLQGGRKHALGEANGTPNEAEVAEEVAAEQAVDEAQLTAEEVAEGAIPEPAAPVEASTREASADEISRDEASMDEGSMDEGSTDEGSMDDASSDEAVADEAPTGETSAVESSTEEAPFEEDDDSDEPVGAVEEPADSLDSLPPPDSLTALASVPSGEIENPPSDPSLAGEEPFASPEAPSSPSLSASTSAATSTTESSASAGSARRVAAPPIDDLLDNPDLPGFTITEPGQPMPRAPHPPRDGDRGRRRRGRGRRGHDRDRGGHDRERGGGGGGGGDRRDGRDRAQGRDRGRGGREREGRSALPGRISKSTPIREVVKEGQEIIVQLTKEPIGTKGARCSSHISFPGRYVVYLPTVDHLGVSKRIGSDRERARLREAIEAMKPPTGGLIVRTVAEGLTKKQLKQDVGYLVRLWGEIAKKREGARAPALLGSELDIVLKTARDLFTDEVAEIVIDDRTQHDRLCRFVEAFMPERLKDVVFYDEDEPIFDAYGIEDEIGRALSRKVPLPSGGYLIIDQAEALTAIDVNTGRFVGKGSKDMEETILKTNLEAVSEIAYQLRFRNIGGLIILDLIDMERAKNRETVRKKLEELLQRDKAKTTLNRISELGLIEMTRKRTRESLGRLLHEPCFYCDGTGQLQSKETIAYEILREIRRKRNDLPGYTVVVNAHPAVADVLTGTEKGAVAEAENKFMRKITVVPRKEYHLEQFDLVGK